MQWRCGPARGSLALEESECENLKARALLEADAEGLINGKNADARKRQQADILTRSQAVKDAEGNVLRARERIISSQVWCTKMEARVSLTKAWLYSQARIG